MSRSAFAIVNRGSNGVLARLNASGIPASLRAGAFTGAAGGGPFVGQRGVVWVGSLGLKNDGIIGAGKNFCRISSDGDCGRVIGRRRRRVAAEVQHQSGRGAEIVLLIVTTVSELG